MNTTTALAKPIHIYTDAAGNRCADLAGGVRIVGRRVEREDGVEEIHGIAETPKGPIAGKIIIENGEATVSFRMSEETYRALPQMARLAANPFIRQLAKVAEAISEPRRGLPFREGW